MGLLNPLLLLLGAAAAVPLLLHLLQRHQGPRVIFPALRYLRRAEKESARRIRVRQILLMMLRIAAMLLLALTAARPFIRTGGAGHMPTAVVIILDNSMSTGAVADEVRVLDELKARALEMLNLAEPEDRFWLLRAGQPGEPAVPGDAAATALRVRETEATAASADITAALTHARALLDAGADGRAAEIHLLTDMQASAFGAPLAAGAGAPPIVLWHPAGPPPANRSVSNVELGGGISPIADQRSSAAVTITGAADDEVGVRLSVDGRLVAAGTARGGTSAVLALPARAAGTVTGAVEIDADALHADDRRYFVARVLPPPLVSVVGDQPFVDDAVDVLAEAGRVRRTAGRSDVAFLAAAEGITPQQNGTAIITPPVSTTELEAVNRRLAGAGVPWRYDAPRAGEARFPAVPGDPLTQTLQSAQLRVAYRLTATRAVPSDSVLLRLNDNSAWAVRGVRANGGAYVLLGSPLTPEASSIPTSAAMLPLLDRLTGAWSLAEPPRTDVQTGESAAVRGADAVERPDGSRDAISSDLYTFGAEPGVYRVLRGDSLMAAYAVNAPASESDLTRLAERALAARLSGWTVHGTSSADEWQRAAFRERIGREVWRPMLIALLLVLLIETAVAAAGRRTAHTRLDEVEVS